MWACPTGASSMSPSRCEYRPCPAASLQAQALCLSSGLSARLATRPATPPLSGTNPCSLSLSLAPSSSPGSRQPFPYTMTKSSAVLFILIFSLIFRLEELRAALVLVVLLIAGGLFMFTYKSTQFNVEGFALVLGASFIGGIRWTLTQMLLQKAELGLQNPIDTMFHLQPLMFLGLFPLFAVFEGLHLSTSEKIFRFQDTGLLLRVLGSLFLGGILAFGLGFSEFLLVSRTSSLTLSIAGIFKEVCTLLLAAHLLGDQISLLNWLGFALCLSGISLHVALKALHSRGDGGPKPLKGLGSSPDLELLLRNSQQEEGDNEEEYFVAQGQ
ncbi:solute carrier family 35 member C2 isoform X2 [Saimiri boliviensis]|uniref:solute carrier family 35 member C2 isoform X2 n=1 Tax=Saimiri boliviensis TaxID=27679 RepID=UPI000533E9C2|nr:solute carrier family 35 member C2 isoform X2 [Saimiri boliviensis boliviensis]XP_010345231.1 solute carrier family 35 member C2 isoform X2 [Saimiri boliviensis boliviensis]XP_010345232.1 solute carrier family 35 member C2 isoform X2 [Saimiri boliviensis boliviensis]